MRLSTRRSSAMRAPAPYRWRRAASVVAPQAISSETRQSDPQLEMQNRLARPAQAPAMDLWDVGWSRAMKATASG